VKFFLPDSQDLIDPTYDFERERRSDLRQRQRDDIYAHEFFSTLAFDGLLLSKGIVDGIGGSGGRYTPAQRKRLLRLGAPRFFRMERAPAPLEFMGDCGAFTYVDEEEPPYSVQEVLDFYEFCRVDFGVSLDHVILQFEPAADEPGDGSASIDDPVRRRQELTLELAREFLRQHRGSRLGFEPLGAAQGWSPGSYATAVKALQKMGYEAIALGGMVPLKSQEILMCLEEIQRVRRPGTRLHLLGVTRPEHLQEFARLGVTSFDSTSPLRQAFKDARDNYYLENLRYTALRIPQVEGNLGMQRRIACGAVSQEQARRLERDCLEAMKRFEQGRRTVGQVLKVLLEYEQLYDPEAKKDYAEAYEKTLREAPWRRCPCEVCQELGHHVIIFRGAERNRRRGFHNVWTFYRQLKNLERGVARTPAKPRQPPVRAKLQARG
jgi:hypothetical protein